MSGLVITPLEATTVIVVIVTALGGGVVVQWLSARASRKGAVSAFVNETRQNAMMLNRNIIAINEERRNNTFLSTPLVPLVTFSLDRLPIPVPKELLVDIEMTDSVGRRLHSKEVLRIGATMCLTYLRSSIAEFNAAVNRHEHLVGSPHAFPGLLAGLDTAIFSAHAAFAEVANCLVSHRDREEILGWINVKDQQSRPKEKAD